MKNKGWISVLFFLLLIITSITVRLYYVNNFMSNVEINEEIYNTAKVSAAGIDFSGIFAKGVSIKSLYICCLYAAFIIFGNFTVAGVYLNAVCQVFTVIILFAAVKNISNRYIGFIVGFIAAIMPAYFKNISRVTSVDLAIVFAVFIFMIVTSVLNIVLKHMKSKKQNPVVVETDILPVQEAEPIQVNDIKVFEDTSMTEIHIEDIEEKKINYIENPLPVPKRREHKEMDFAVELTSENDDYDINDISGKDFFDIE